MFEGISSLAKARGYSLLEISCDDLTKLTDQYVANGVNFVPVSVFCFQPRFCLLTADALSTWLSTAHPLSAFHFVDAIA